MTDTKRERGCDGSTSCVVVEFSFSTLYFYSVSLGFLLDFTIMLAFGVFDYC